MGFHFFSDILCGVALGAALVLASQKLPIPCLPFKILKLQRKWSIAFCVTMFIATYSLATFAADLRELGNMICASGPRFFRLDTGGAGANVVQTLSPKPGGIVL